MSIVISFEDRAKIAKRLEPSKPRKLDCQGERGPYAVNLMDQLNKVKAGLDAGMSAAEIRQHEIWQCQARIRHEAQRLHGFSGPVEAAWFLRSVADETESSS